MPFHAFAGNPFLSIKRDSVSDQDLYEAESAGTLRILPLLEGKPLVSASPTQIWRLAWQSLGTCRNAVISAFNNALDSELSSELAGGALDQDKLVYLGDDKAGIIYCALDVSLVPSMDKTAQDKWTQSLAKEWETPASNSKVAFIDLRLLMTGTDCSDTPSMEHLSIAGHKFRPWEVPTSDSKVVFVDLRLLMTGADCSDTPSMEHLFTAGHARALVEWHTRSRFCGRCGSSTVPREVGKRRQCGNDICKRKFYPRLDPVVIMLVIDKENGCVILGRQSRFVPRLWSCLAGFIETGESLEEAVRRETKEEVGIEVGKIVYHSSQPWPVGPSSMSYQLMVGFFAFATTFDIRVDKKELEEARWFSREQVRNALTYSEFTSQQQAAATRIYQTCSRDERKKGSSSTDLRVEAADLPSMFVPGPYAIAHHLIAAWAMHESDEIWSKI